MSQPDTAHWPKDVTPLSWNDSGLIGVHRKTRQLYWDGERIQTISRLGTPERIFAIIVTLATASMAIVDLIRLYNGN